MSVVAILNFILLKSQPLLSILGLTSAVPAVSLAAIISIASLMRYHFKKNDCESDLEEESDLQYESDVEYESDLEIPIVPSFKGKQTKIQEAKIGIGLYKPEPKIVGKYYDTLETIVAIHAYRDLCLHIENTISQPEKYSIEYKTENNSLTAYLHAPQGVSRINIDNIFLELNGRFNVVLKLLTHWDKDCKKIGVLQKHLSKKESSIYKSDNESRTIYKKILEKLNNDELSFLEYTAGFWGQDEPCKLLNSFIWSNPSQALQKCKGFSDNISLLIIMPIAFTKYLSMMKNRGHKSKKTLQRTEGNFCSYQENDVIDCKIFRPFSQIHPADTTVCIKFYTNPNFIVLKNYTGGQLCHASTYKIEQEVVVEPSVIITVNTITDSTERRANDPYKKIEISAVEKPAIANVYLANAPVAILSSLFEKSVAHQFKGENVNVLSTILEYTGLPSEVSNNKLEKRVKEINNKLA